MDKSSTDQSQATPSNPIKNTSANTVKDSEVKDDATKDRELARYLLPTVIEHTYGKTDYLEAWRDLNGDQIKDAVVLLQGKEWCGSGGCTMLIYHAKNDHSLSLITKTTVTDTPIYQLSTKQNGWSDLSVYSKGVGQVKFSFDGKSYPSNPSLEKPYQIQPMDQKLALSELLALN
ncbi:hypothetical protein [Acinetobacter sp.]|uniref:hypothetical protein n=1 Tax=Acinetobacter sp. TaxID=472 RepID=UPI0035B01109